MSEVSPLFCSDYSNNSQIPSPSVEIMTHWVRDYSRDMRYTSRFLFTFILFLSSFPFSLLSSLFFQSLPSFLSLLLSLLFPLHFLRTYSSSLCSLSNVLTKDYVHFLVGRDTLPDFSFLSTLLSNTLYRSFFSPLFSLLSPLSSPLTLLSLFSPFSLLFSFFCSFLLLFLSLFFSSFPFPPLSSIFSSLYLFPTLLAASVPRTQWTLISLLRNL